MKKLILSVAVLSAILVTSCGPSAEEIAKKAQLRMDSIAKVSEDSLMMVEAEKAKMMQDSINMAMEKMRADSILMAEEAAAMKKGGSKPKPKKAEPKQEAPARGGAVKEGTAVDPAKVNNARGGAVKK